MWLIVCYYYKFSFFDGGRDLLVKKKTAFVLTCFTLHSTDKNKEWYNKQNKTKT